MSHEDIVAEVWREVRGSVLELLHQLVADADAVASGTATADTWPRVRDVTHRLAGTLGSFSQQPAGENAVALEQLISGVDVPDDELATRAHHQVAVVHDSFPHAPDECPAAGAPGASG